MAAFIISIIAGLWMLAMGGMMGWGWGWGWGHYMVGRAGGGGYGWMWRQHQFMHGYGGAFVWSWIGLICGIIVLIGAFALYARPAAARNWGVVILIVSAVDLFAGAGGFLAGIVGIVGGFLAIAWNAQPR